MKELCRQLQKEVNCRYDFDSESETIFIDREDCCWTYEIISFQDFKEFYGFDMELENEEEHQERDFKYVLIIDDVFVEYYGVNNVDDILKII